jgi:Cu2+-exporting ATPase
MTSLSANRPLTPAADSASTAVACAHCHLPVPAGLVESAATHQFCCHGCRTVFGLLNEAALGGFYDVCRAVDAPPTRPNATGRGYEEFDDPAFHAIHVRPGPGGVLSAELVLENVHCAACVWLLERLARVNPGVAESRVSFRRATIALAWRPDRTSLSAIARTLDSLGYPPRPSRAADAREARLAQDRRALVGLAVSGACAGNIMLLAVALYAGMFQGIEHAHETLFRWVSLGLALVSLLGPGRTFFRSAIAALRTRTPSLDIPIALALAVGGTSGTVNVVRGSGEIYFDSLAVLTFLLLVGRFVQARQQRLAASRVELLYTLTPTRAERVEPDGAVRTVPIEAVRAGDTVRVRAGAAVPVDGTISAGRTSLDESLLTGESRPVDAAAGDAVAAGATNLSAQIDVTATATGEATRIGRLMAMVAEAAERRAPIVRRADRLAVWFVAAVLTLAVGTFVAWLFVAPGEAAEHAVALLIITCPCALGLATPLAMTVGLGRAARRGILVKGADAFERLAIPGTVLLDKTGTLTEPGLALVGWTVEPGSGEDEVLALAASLESGSTHPVAGAIVAAAKARGLAIEPAADTTHHLARGVEGLAAGRSVLVGSPAFLASRGIDLPPKLAEAAESAARAAQTPVAVAIDGRSVAVAAIGAAIRADAADAIEHLRARGWRVRLLSGDHPDAVRAVGATLGIDAADCLGGVSPEGKLAAVKAEPVGPVVMVGDGVNDAAALAAADVGLAVHGGAEASLHAADAYLTRPGVLGVVETIDRARGVITNIRACIAVSLSYNAVAAALAATGQLDALVAAVLMPLSSLAVVAIALRTGRADRAVVSASPPAAETIK